jgi:hypothetical protein
MALEQYYTPQQIGEALQLAPSTILEYLAHYRIRVLVSKNNRVRVSERAVMRLVRLLSRVRRRAPSRQPEARRAQGAKDHDRRRAETWNSPERKVV